MPNSVEDTANGGSLVDDSRRVVSIATECARLSLVFAVRLAFYSVVFIVVVKAENCDPRPAAEARAPDFAYRVSRILYSDHHYINSDLRLPTGDERAADAAVS